MSDNSQPVSSRRALREKRRAEMEALLASSKAEQEARELADEKKAGQTEQSAKPAKADATASAKPNPKPEAAKPQAAKPAPKPAPNAKAESEVQKPTSKAPAKDASTASASKPSPVKGNQEQAAKPKPKVTPEANAAASTSSSTTQKSDEEPMGERASLRRARNREALRERRRLEGEVDALTSHIPTVEPADEPKPLTRRQLRLQALAEQGKTDQAAAPKPAAKPEQKPTSDDDSPETTVMSVEQALAARRAHAPKAPIDPNLLGEDDSEIDLEVLAHQREMAARAAIISRRAAERERLRVENAKQGKDDKSSDPFTGAMGNIREVEDRIAKTGVQGPKTQSVSLNLDSDGKISSKKDQAAPAAKKPAPKPAAKAAPKPAAAKPAAKPAPKPAAKAASQAASKPAAKTAPKPAGEPKKSAPVSEAVADVQMPRIDAVNAHGLEPLDVQTHGVRRANNMLIAMIVALSVGGAALIAGLIMLLGN
ncbi:hypothetical protein [Arthrobacter sp. NIO-1057]|uniref:hypothetical protein n=1 Tax=Arthrobacter sp. NIO-1057 TaxID=993071 RepID=UPI00071C689F|nr:hypothetical protein [Arthrobacter sp. NIO-1057]KSU68059.1 hypothetical protein AS038_02915 [Arthrobacter sp. NIO-1057]SCB87285.1 hypothetical protein GA0061084_0591 [Arthrobacter sp. NIO-1057]